MLDILWFESKKIFRSTFFLVLLSIVGVLLVSYYIYVYQQTVRVEELIEDVEDRIQIQENSVQSLKDEIENTEEGVGTLQNDLEVNEQFLQRYQATLTAYQEEDWLALLEIEIEQVSESVRMRQNQQYSYTVSTHPSRFTLESKLDYLFWLSDRNMMPVFPIDITAWMTVYDLSFAGDDPRVEEFVKDQSDKYSSSGVNFLNHVTDILLTTFGVVGFLFLFGNVLTKEGLGRNGPINFLHTQPLSKFKIFLGKFLTLFVLSAMILAILSLISILLGSLFDRVGDFNYPVLIYGAEYTFTFMNMGTFILLSLGFFLLVLLFSYSLLFLFSVVTKRTITAIGLTIAVIYIGILLSEDAILSAVSPYIPFHYFSVTDIVSNTYAASVGNFSFSAITGSVVLLISTLIVLSLAYLLFNSQYKSINKSQGGGSDDHSSQEFKKTV